MARQLPNRQEAIDLLLNEYQHLLNRSEKWRKYLLKPLPLVAENDFIVSCIDRPIPYPTAIGMVICKGQIYETTVSGKGTITPYNQLDYPWVYEGQINNGVAQGLGVKCWTENVYAEFGLFENNELSRGLGKQNNRIQRVMFNSQEIIQ